MQWQPALQPKRREKWTLRLQLMKRFPTRHLSPLVYKNFLDVGAPRFDQNEQKVVRKMQQEMDVEERGLVEEILTFEKITSVVTDNSEHSWFSLSAMVWVTTAPIGIGWHNWQFAAAARPSIGKKVMIVASKVLAATAMISLSNLK